jgi:hypothetical protein
MTSELELTDGLRRFVGRDYSNVNIFNECNISDIFEIKLDCALGTDIKRLADDLEKYCQNPSLISSISFSTQASKKGQILCFKIIWARNRRTITPRQPSIVEVKEKKIENTFDFRRVFYIFCILMIIVTMMISYKNKRTIDDWIFHLIK